MNFLIHVDNDALFSAGIAGLIQDAAAENSISPVNVSYEYTVENIQKADFIFITVCAGEYYLCFNDLIYKKSTAKVFLFVSSNNIPDNALLPECIKEATFFPQKTSSGEVRAALSEALRRYRQSNDLKPVGKKNWACLDCNYKTLSFTQDKIVRGLNNCLSINEIADRIGIHYKTAVSHKKNIMSKFNLHSKTELYEFISCYQKKKQ